LERESSWFIGDDGGIAFKSTGKNQKQKIKGKKEIFTQNKIL